MSFDGDYFFSSSTGIYQSKWHSSPLLPLSPSLSLPSYLFNLPIPSISSPSFIDSVSGFSLSFSDLRSLALSASLSLHSLGISNGDVVLLVSPNSIYFPVIVLAIMSLGAVFTTANFLLTRQELESQIRDSNVSLILTTSDLSHKLDNLISKPLVLIQDFISNLKPTPNNITILANTSIKTTDTAALMYSSGTTGKSKAVICSHGNLIAMSCILRDVWGGFGRNETYLCTIPMFHMFGFSVFVCGALAMMTPVVVMRRYVIEDMLTAMKRHRVTKLLAVPPMIIQMVRVAGKGRRWELSCLKEVVCSGAPLPREYMEMFVECYPGVTLSQCYGLTETSGPITLCDGVKGRFHVSIGRLIPTMEAKIRDVHTNKALPFNKYGELLVRGPPLMQGYLNNEEATSMAIDDEGWLHTGDLCYIDRRGLIYVVDRIKELIKYKAYQVAPAELEEILQTHPEVHDVAVIPYPDDEAGEIPMACVVRKPGSSFKEDELISFTEKKVAPYKKIRKVIFVDVIPRSPSGKILRRLIKAKVVQQQGTEISARL
ncbi:putative 4-coumarate--CoA ligase-like 8 [Dioscorea cayenensis subsp. rotundata]|uniref:4-coumarate--CoA ligase n=1 Tax=Dioscorea cayennensis subsp. rotundata TaxID=55577 RepID=A0AB40BSC0_DIOCR|nr:putative 4-coumarate--CoA ligase-like 8 [Dioscorea cayenensis subsp. rotundata]